MERQTIANTSNNSLKLKSECEFLGSVNTLISPAVLRNMVYDNPITKNAGLDIYENQKRNIIILLLLMWQEDLEMTILRL